MKIQEIIFQELEKLVAENPQLQFTYELDKRDDTHCIEVLPKTFNQNEAYKQFKADFVFRLSQEFPCDFLFFSTDESIYKIENPTQIILGKAFVEESKYKDLASISNFLKEVKPLYKTYTNLYICCLFPAS